MEIIINVTIPDSVAVTIQNDGTTPLPRRLLEVAAIKAHEASLITECELAASIPALMQSQDRSWQRGWLEDNPQPAPPSLPEARQPNILLDRLVEPERAWCEAGVCRQ